MENVKNFIFQEKVIGPILILIVSFILTKIIKSFVSRIVSRGKKEEAFIKKRKTIIEIINKIVKFFIYAIAIIMILNIYGVDTNGILASLGIAGVVLGLALQDTVQDLISGATIILDNYYVIGDIIRINNFTGEVIDVTLKSTKAKNANGEIYIFANRNVKEVVNLSQENAGIKIEIPTAYEEKVAKVEKVLKEIVEEAKKLEFVSEDSKYLGIERLDPSSITYAIMIKCNWQEQWDIKRKVLKLIVDTYEKENIKIPYNQIEVHNGKKTI